MISWSRMALCKLKPSRTSRHLQLLRQRWSSFRKTWLSTLTKQTTWNMPRTWHKPRWVHNVSIVAVRCTKTRRWARAWRSATTRTTTHPLWPAIARLNSSNLSYVNKINAYHMNHSTNNSNKLTTISKEAPWTVLELSLIAQILAEATGTKVLRSAQVMLQQRKVVNWIY